MLFIKDFLFCKHEKASTCRKGNQAFHKSGAEWNKLVCFGNTEAYIKMICERWCFIWGFKALIRKHTSTAVRRFCLCECAAVSGANTVSGKQARAYASDSYLQISGERRDIYLPLANIPDYPQSEGNNRKLIATRFVLCKVQNLLITVFSISSSARINDKHLSYWSGSKHDPTHQTPCFPPVARIIWEYESQSIWFGV